MAGAHFKLCKNADQLFFFEFFDKEGTRLLMSGEYESKEDAAQSIKDVQVGSLMSPQIGAGKTPDGDSFFVIKNNSGQVLVKSVLFESDMVFNNALHRVKDSACIAETVDLT
ncbi:hypothetical protein [Ketobacter sp.]|uniref:hypothetical protein n=1 Tax=Ketobacter sp. TaxID=2083498 RepID=UPI0025C4C8A2|nr:hypothetical protein [Ketobacter sp.]